MRAAEIRETSGVIPGTTDVLLVCEHGRTHGQRTAGRRDRGVLDELVSRHVARYGCSCAASLIQEAARAAAGGGRR